MALRDAAKLPGAGAVKGLSLGFSATGVLVTISGEAIAARIAASASAIEAPIGVPTTLPEIE
jgi:hypothetical protein